MAGLGRKVWTQETLSVPDVQGYLQDQVVLRFANAAARDAAITAPAEGMCCTLDDTDQVLRHDGTRWRKIAGPVLSLLALENLSAGSAVAVNTGPVYPITGIGPIPAHTAGPLRVQWLGSSVMGTGAPIAGHVQLAWNTANSTSGATLQGIRVRFHNNSSSPQCFWTIDETFSSDGAAKYLFLAAWNDAASANTWSPFTGTVHAWL